jgi:hypothetical protein
VARRLRFAPFALVLACLSSAAFTASASAAPRNDDFRNALRLTAGQPVNGTINGATKQRSEPRHGRSLAKHSVWYRIGTSRRVAIALSTCNSNFDSVVAVYSGRRLGALREVEFNNDGGCGNGGSRVTFTARPGRVYRIAVAGFTARGRFRMTVRSLNTPPNDDFVDAVPIRLGETIGGTTRNATRELDEPRHAGLSADLTVWFRLNVASPRTVQVDTCRNFAFDTVLAVYTGRTVSRLRDVTSDDDSCGLGSSVEFNAQAGVTYRIAVAEYGANRSGSFSLSARSLGAP